MEKQIVHIRPEELNGNYFIQNGEMTFYRILCKTLGKDYNQIESIPQKNLCITVTD